MARNVQDINPDDVFPRRNLPGEAESWGRTLEDRVIALEKGYISQGASIQGANRFTASSAASTSDQLTALISILTGGISISTAGIRTNTQSIAFDGATTGTGGVTLWTTTPELIPWGFSDLTVISFLNVAAKYPDLEPRFSIGYRINGTPVTGTSQIDSLGESSPGPLLGNGSSTLTTLTVCDVRQFNVSGMSGDDLRVGFTVGFYSGAVPVANQTILPDISGTSLIFYHN